MPQYRSASGSVAEDLFIDLFSDAFGAEKAGYLYSQYHFYDIYQNSRYADFVLENGPRRVAIEIDDEDRFPTQSRHNGCSGRCRRSDIGSRGILPSLRQRHRQTGQ